MAEMTAFQWLGWETLGLPRDVATSISEADNMAYAKAVLVCAAGDGVIAPEERDWIVGYLTTAGVPAAVVEAMKTYDGSDSIEDLMAATPMMPVFGRSMIYDALRACASDGEISPGERARIDTVASRIGLAAEVVDELEAIVHEEEGLRRRRYQLIVAEPMAMASA